MYNIHVCYKSMLQRNSMLQLLREWSIRLLKQQNFTFFRFKKRYLIRYSFIPFKVACPQISQEVFLGFFWSGFTLHQFSKGSLTSFTGGGRPQVRFHVLFQAPQSRTAESPTFHKKESKVHYQQR
jgi:hypothetical protein